jgi:hypothetical protein
MRKSVSAYTKLLAVIFIVGGASIASPAFAAACLHPGLPQHTLAENSTTDAQKAFDAIAKLGNRCATTQPTAGILSRSALSPVRSSTPLITPNSGGSQGGTTYRFY